MHSYSNTDFPGLPVIQFLIILCIESNSINSTIRIRLLLQFIHFRKVLLEAEAFYSLPRHPEIHSTQRTFKILPILQYKGFPNQKDNSTIRSLQFIHSFMQYTSVYLQDLPRHSRHSTGLHPNPAFFK